jgi:hypothetical protein
MMKAILIGTIVFIFLAEAALLYREFYIRRKFRKLSITKYKKIEPLHRKLAEDAEIAEAELSKIAEDPSLRCGLFRMLDAYDKNEIFPAAYFTIEKGAEGHLVNWLEFPTELGNAPDEIEIISKIALAEGIEYYVFKYRSQWPRWARQLGWMIGVSGPYQEKSNPYDVPARVFSRFNTLGSISPEMEVAWVHKNINPKNSSVFS